MIVPMKRNLMIRGGHMPNLWKSHLVALAAVVGTCAGCYDGQALVEQARSVALNTRLAEVDLGMFYTTLPRDADSTSLTEVKVHIFGTVPRYRVPEIEKQLKTETYRLRHETLSAVRKSSREELAEPNFTRLRTRIESVVNGILADAPVKTIGFYDIAMRQM
jgi:hypothetical protein